MPESRFAVFSDIHANLEALQAVLADMDAQGITRRVCLGDIVGYAANPRQCLQLVRSLGCKIVKGNHDAAAAGDDALDDMRDVAQSGIEFARRKLSPEQRAYLAALPLTIADGNCEFVHASRSEPAAWNYITTEREALDHFAAQTRPLAFCGHTHVPMALHLGNTGNLRAWGGRGRLELPGGGKTLINVGSVGQPRDLIPSACYVICDPDAGWVEFRRIDYDIKKAKRKIYRAKLPRFIGQRLSIGR